MANRSNGLNADMFSRVGKTCKEQAVVVDKTQHILDGKRAWLRARSLANKVTKHPNGNEVDVSQLFRFYKSIERERSEAARKLRAQEDSSASPSVTALRQRSSCSRVQPSQNASENDFASPSRPPPSSPPPERTAKPYWRSERR